MIQSAQDKDAQRETQRLANFPRFNPNPVLELSAAGEINFFNDATQAMVRELGRENAAQMLPPNTAAIVSDCLASGAPKLRVETQIGSRVISWSFFPVIVTNTVHCYAGDITARKQTEKALRDSEVRFRLLFNGGYDAAFVHEGPDEQGLPGKFLEVNDIACQRLGYTREELLRMTPFDLDAPERRHAIPAIVKRLRKEQEATWETVLVCKDGRQFPVEIRSRLFEFGAKLAYLSIIRDITDRKAAEARLRLLSTALEATAAAVLITDRQGLIQWVNPAFTELTGYSFQEAAGQKASLLKSGAHDTVFYRGLWDTILAGKVWRAAMVNRRKDGSHYTEENTITPVRDHQGAIAYFVAVKQDITERERAEGELRWKTAFLEAQVNSSLDGILVVDGEGKLILQNQQSIQMWKIPPEIAIAVDYRKRLDFALGRVKNPQEFLKKVEFLYAHPEEVSRDEVELVDGVILDRYSWPVVGHDGTYYGRIWVFRDITERRLLEATFRQSQKMGAVGQLAGGVAHDFNNMLAVIRGSAELLLLECDAPTPAVADCITNIVSASEKAANLTRQLLIFSRKQRMQPRPVAMNDLVKNLTQMLKRLIREDIQLECVYAEGLPFVQADPGMMEQMLFNLVVNARDAIPGSGQIRISTEKITLNEASLRSQPNARPGDFICLSVADTGVGILPENLPHIFDPFFTTKEPGKGTGLGLATVYGIMQQQQGWVEVSSQVGKGTIFKLLLPAIPAPAVPGNAPKAESNLRGGTETILLVEDDHNVRFTTRRMLEISGYKVCEASCGQEALEIWGKQTGEIALLLSDIVMPGGMSGRVSGRKVVD